MIGGSGNGEQIAANKVPGIRAALAWSVETAQLARQHNDAQVVGDRGPDAHARGGGGDRRGVRGHPVLREERHQRRIAALAEYERTGAPPALPEA